MNEGERGEAGGDGEDWPRRREDAAGRGHSEREEREEQQKPKGGEPAGQTREEKTQEKGPGA